MKTETMLERAKARAEKNLTPKDLKDVRDVRIDPSLEGEERLRDFIKQIGNPYIYRSGDVVVRVEFAGSVPFEECISRLVDGLANWDAVPLEAHRVQP